MAQAKYQEIADRLRDQITSGILAPDDRLPSEPDLERQFSASRNTVRLALALLTNQGLVVTRQGLGTFVLVPAKPFTALLSRVQGQPSGHHASLAMPVVGPDPSKPETVRFVVETVPASASVADKLAVGPGEQVIVRRTSQHIDGVPWLLINSYFPTDLAGDTALAQAGLIPQGSIKLLAELGHEQAGFVDEIGARMPDTRELSFFRLSTGMPVIVVNRTSYSKDRPIRLTRYIYRGDRVRLAHVEGSIPARYRHD
ncbi:MAG TPA: GntR family transcriptional regulator [Streptosporangiaceae bacterium]|nr:GntR family transcriptional regulator [Streptosporangiaceae bacterium]